MLAASGIRSSRLLSTVAGGAPSVTLYQYDICPFCHKAKALLEYAGIRYDAVEVNPLTKAEIQWSTDYKKVPIAKLNDSTFCGSDAILDGLLDNDHVVSKLDTKWSGTNMNMNYFRSKGARKWISFANKELATLLYPNICRTLSDSYQAFGYVDQVATFSSFQKISIRSAGSLAMYFAASRIKKKRNISDERAALASSLSLLEETGLSTSSGFLSDADVPDLGDLAVYGTIRSIQGLPAHEEFIRDRAGIISTWYSRMADHVELGE